MGVTAHFLKGQNIIEEGSIGDRTFKVIQGEVLIYKEAPMHNLIPVAKLGPGDIFGEMYLMKEGKYRTASVLALSDVEVYVYFEDDVIKIISEMNPFLQAVIDTLGKRLDSVTQELVNTISEHEDNQEFSFKSPSY